MIEFLTQNIILLLIAQSPVINEVYPNPPGPESGSGSPGDRFEWIELFNPTNFPQPISGLWISDGDEADSLVPVQDSAYTIAFPGVRIFTDTLPPQGFALILDREFLTTPDTTYPIQIAPHTILLTTPDTDLGNGLSNSDPIVLFTMAGDTLDTYGTPGIPDDSLPLSPEDGVSIERVLWSEEDQWGNWRPSRWGASPGQTNSWSLDLDLGWVADSLQITPALPTPLDSLTLRCFLMNFGRSLVSSFEVDLTWGPYSDHRSFSLPLEPDSGISLVFRGPALPTGPQVLSLALATQDEDSTDDRVSHTVFVGIAPVVINEIMYNDEVEWIEIYNRGTDVLSLGGFEIGDSAGGRTGPLPDSVLAAHGYLVIAASEAFASRFPNVRYVVPPNGLPTLNNTQETVFLWVASGTLWDRVYYRSSYGGGPGVSLERVSPELPSSLASNWASCQDPSGATPGRQNSVYLNPETNKATLTLTPKSVRPGGSVLISYDLSIPRVDLQILVFDLRGRLVGRPVDERNLPGVGEVLWKAPKLPGLYIVYLHATSGRRRIQHRKTFIVLP